MEVVVNFYYEIIDKLKLSGFHKTVLSHIGKYNYTAVVSKSFEFIIVVENC